jgi:uncharacterized protein YdeI (BOF family)
MGPSHKVVLALEAEDPPMSPFYRSANLLNGGTSSRGSASKGHRDMKKFRIVLTMASALLAVSLAAQQARTFTGEIMDSQCAAMGSHQTMMQKMGAKDAKDCTDKCVEAGGKYVLYDSSAKMIYQLDDQEKAKQFSGQKVKVNGSFDRDSKTIHVADIERGS